MSLAQLTAWCDARFGPHPVAAHTRGRPYDIPWVVMDHAASRAFGWEPRMTVAAHSGRDRRARRSASGLAERTGA